DAFRASFERPATQDRARRLFALGLQQRGEAERHLGRYLEQIVAPEGCTHTPQTTAPGVLTSQTIAVEHVKISSERSFAEVRRRLEDTLPKLDGSIVEALRSGDQKRVTEYEENGPELSIIEQRDHGALLQAFGGTRNALQYEIGNPSTASKLMRYQLS